MLIRRPVWLLLAALMQGAPFRSGLTATVVMKPGAGGQSCGEVTLRWAPHPAARSYRSYVAPARNGAWTALPETSACGTGRASGATGLVDPQPAPSGGPRRLFYRVIAIGPNGPIDSTDVVPVELAPSSSSGRP